MARKFFVGGNWKMNGTKNEINEIVNFLKTGPLDVNVGTYNFLRTISLLSSLRLPLLLPVMTLMG